MPLSKTETQSSTRSLLRAKIRDYSLLFKLRLSLTVVFSAAISYILAADLHFSAPGLFMIILGGFLITASANALNEIIEKDYDKLMVRTQKRPLPADRMSTVEAVLMAGLLGVAGILILALYFNYLAAVLGAVSLFSYAFIYTPLKRYTNLSVLVGAIPGALPIVIGWVAFTGEISPEVYALFAIQVMWQFPHFWSIAWLSHDDYSNAGFRMLPSYEGKGRSSAAQILLFSIFLLPVSLAPVSLGYFSWIYGSVAILLGLMMIRQALKLYRSCETKDARKLMFASLLYLPVLLLSMIADKLI
jgi:protoheme IX farnesyltransferase